MSKLAPLPELAKLPELTASAGLPAAPKALAAATEDSAEAPDLTSSGSSVEPMSAELIASLKARALGDLFFFAKGVLGFDRLTAWIHRPLCRLLELYAGYDELNLHAPWSEYEQVLKDVLRRMEVPEEDWPKRIAEAKANGLKKLLILLPRTWYKTTLGSIAYPLWRGCRDQNVRILLAQNTATNARAKGIALAGLVDGCENLRMLFPEIVPPPRAKWSADGRTLNRSKSFAESTYEFAGIRTQVTSRHFNEIIEDDTVAPDKDDLSEQAILPSRQDVAQAIGWHRLVPPLLDEFERDRNIVTGTRWFELDLLRWIMENEPEFWVYQRAVRENFAGQPDVKGALTWASRFSDRALLAIAAALGPYLYSCLYMNTPIREGDMLFHSEWIKYYDVEPSNLMTFTTVDVANDPEDVKGEPDYNVVLTCGKDMDNGQIFVLDYSRERCSPSRLLEMIFAHVSKWHPATVGLETVAYQKSLMHWIRQHQRSTGNYFVVTQLSHTKTSKNARIRGLQPAMSLGALRFRPEMKALVNELLVFPLGKNDDIIDALAMQLELWRLTPCAQEEAKLWEGGPNDFETVLNLARATQREENAKKIAAAARPPAAWGASIPVLVFHPDGFQSRGSERPSWQGQTH